MLLLLAIVIGRRCRHLGDDVDVRVFIRGYVQVNDVTARDIQKSDGQWTRDKGFVEVAIAGLGVLRHGLVAGIDSISSSMNPCAFSIAICQSAES